MPPLFIRLVMTLATLAVLGSCSSQRSRSPVQRYIPISRAMLPLGELRLGGAQMQFSELDGEMKLQYVGLMPASAGDDLGGASVYRVRNDAAYFKKNAGRSGYCEQAPRWVAVNSDNGAPAWSREIRVALLTVEEWARYSPADSRPCAAGEYVRAPR